MLPEARVPVHPGTILLEEFLEPLHLSAVYLARHLRTPVEIIESLLAGERAITAELAWRLAQAFGTTPELWMNLQVQYDLARAKSETQMPPLLARS